MDYIESIQVLKVAYEKIEDERLWQMYLQESQHQDVGNFLQYKEKLIEKSKIKNRTTEQIKFDIEEAREIAKKALEVLDPRKNIGKILKKDN